MVKIVLAPEWQLLESEQEGEEEGEKEAAEAQLDPVLALARKAVRAAQSERRKSERLLAHSVEVVKAGMWGGAGRFLGGSGGGGGGGGGGGAGGSGAEE